MAEVFARDGLGKLSVRLRVAARAAAEQILRASLPPPGRTVTVGGRTIFAVSPTEWMIVLPIAETGDASGALQTGLAGQDAAVIDISCNTAVLGVSGAAALGLLYRGAAIELEPPAFAAGHCATTKIGRITTLLHRLNDAPTFDLYVSRSLQQSLLCWLQDIPPMR